MVDAAIRRARPDDAGDIARVHIATWRTTYAGIVPQPYLDSLDLAERAQAWRERLEGGDLLIYIAEAAGTLCGFSSGGPLREPVGDCDCEVYAIYVLAESQQRGVGRRLMSALAAELAKQGYARPAVWVLAENPSRQFYARLGAQPMAEKQIEIGGASLVEVAYGWDSMNPLLTIERNPERQP